MAKASGNTRTVRPKAGRENGVKKRRKSIREIASENISSILGDINRDGFSRNQTPFSIGRIEQRMKDYAIANNIELGGQDVYMSAESIAHTFRKSKVDGGRSIEQDSLASFPLRRNSMRLYHEKEDNSFVYFDGANKYVLRPNYETKKLDGKPKVVWFVTASKSDGQEFNMTKYTEIKKKT